MTVYHEIRTAAFTPPSPARQPFTGLYHALAFPRPWRQAILDLYRHGKNQPRQVQAGPHQVSQRRDPRDRARPGVGREERDGRR